MKVDIWSDTRCPFCFIGKRNFEKALQKFSQNDKVVVNWHSFQLDPNMKTDLSKNHYEYLSEVKGFPMAQIMQMHENLIQSGKNAGIDFNFDEVKVSNSFKSQMLVQFAKEKGKADEMEELLFEAYFKLGKDIDDVEVLSEIGEKMGFSKDEIAKSLQSKELSELVNNDITEASNLGIRGVPFFVFNQKYAISGAQPTHLFSEVLEKSWTEFSENDSKLKIIEEGDSCDVEGNC
ncbi:DsbA family oxidoreductase [Epilithonimonas ginsengisoli]|uniref:DsbA family oxidoreductase n=1 Tax=Epilithonimonas ginsengisoli TaxID=1245592 RepID=A0ABU4JGF4_9FLAO|nr:MULTISPECIES: DsbA family oxidoreductase [Chryseobacterium group]MBV6880207.1 DsbA family oxidoreductase [Epilithonimonas sp. FP105]MDW8548765.1 DsbA family oxidoreductase [Epilithonimonas ginsengisoli]OAH76148.1 disulfide bond formation protein DsbA [Chryseobacterium sp. FP211-J200]